MTLPEYLRTQQELIDRHLDRLVPAETVPPETIHRAMRYSLFAGGKRIRPILFLEAARSVIGDDLPGAPDAACTLEFIHTYSLIHDDLPALDNDDYRRGKLTNHKVFGEAMAILAGDSLLTLAFEILPKLEHPVAEQRVRMIAELATASGTVGGMIGGQVADIEGERKPPTAELLETIHRAKTGALLRASVRMGAIYAGASDQQVEALSCYGEHIGLAFQIVDDILDVEESSAALGKTAGKDAAQGKITFPAVYGLDRSHQMAAVECDRAHQVLEPFGDRAQRLREIASHIVQRKS
jgi:geranylgeranyl diphosphate synthase type II